MTSMTLANLHEIENSRDGEHATGASGGRGASGDIVGGAIKVLLQARPRYVGVYAPGDYASPQYRLVIPGRQGGKWGRGHLGAREEIILEAADRAPIEELLARLQELVGHEGGPLAIRHIVNPSSTKDEGIRLIWPRRTANDDAHVHAQADASTSAQEEMADWSRRDRLIRAGRTVRAADDDLVPYYACAMSNWYPAYEGSRFPLQPAYPWAHGAVPMILPPPYHAPISALTMLSANDPISPVSPVDLEKHASAAMHDEVRTTEVRFGAQ